MRNSKKSSQKIDKKFLRQYLKIKQAMKTTYKEVVYLILPLIDNLKNVAGTEYATVSKVTSFRKKLSKAWDKELTKFFSGYGIEQVKGQYDFKGHDKEEEIKEAIAKLFETEFEVEVKLDISQDDLIKMAVDYSVAEIEQLSKFIPEA